MTLPESRTTVVESIHLVGIDWPNVTILRSVYLSDPGTWALAANTAEGEPLSAFSVNLDTRPAEGCIWVKTWSEGEGALEELIRLGIVEPTGASCAAGYAVAIEARIIHKDLR